MRLIEELKWRGLVYDVTDPELEELLENEKISFYLGADPTGDSLHIGHLCAFLVAKRLQMHGHKPILLIGGATGFIGDPKPGSEREFLSAERIEFNVKALQKQVEQLMPGCTYVNNFDWIRNISLIDYLRDYGKLFNVNYMINKDTVKSRLETGISYTEFSYQILQALDFHHLYVNNECRLQIGGQDQWGNITAGLELIRKREGHKAKAFGFTIPLVTKSDGTKFGKSEGGQAVWLDPLKTSPYEFYQFLINTSDADAIPRLKQFTFLSKEEIEAIEVQFAAAPHERLAQKTLAKELTTLLHGEEAYKEAIKITQVLFNGDIKELSALQIKQIVSGVKSFHASYSSILKLMLLDINGEKSSIFTDYEIDQIYNNPKSAEVFGLANAHGIYDVSMTLVSALKTLDLAKSNREAREFILKGAISVNGYKITEADFKISREIAIENKYVQIKRGKKQYGFIVFEEETNYETK